MSNASTDYVVFHAPSKLRTTKVAADGDKFYWRYQLRGLEAAQEHTNTARGQTL